jgi:NAD(P)-dependent dehydrogenase (short-subunit alcohol dehydrogenase family)
MPRMQPAPPERSKHSSNPDLPRPKASTGKPPVGAGEVGGFDILVNNAAYVTNKPHKDFSIEHYEDEIRINSSAGFVLARALSTHMKKRRQGRIVFVTSLTLTGEWDGFVPYVASKDAAYGLVKSLACELGHHGINVTGVNPGAIVSEAE